MRPRVKSIFASLRGASGREHFLTLFKNKAVRIERIVSHSYSSPAGFWYDQSEDEWVMVLRGTAVLEWESGEKIKLSRGDYLTIPRRVKHRIARTSPETVWLAVHARKPASRR